MEKWSISLLGAPRAIRGAESARLRSRETWGVLASLVLAGTTGKHTNINSGCCSRESLAGRFWPDARDPSHCLRQSIASIRSAFGPECVIADRQNVALKPGCATSDIEMITLLLEKAAARDDSKRLELLSEADSYLRGGFLEGCIDPGDYAYNWFVTIRAEVDGLILQVLEGLVQCQEAVGDLNGAFDTARRVLQYKPEDTISIERVWDLGRRTNRPHVAEVITATDQFEDALPRITRRARKGLPLTTRESRVFDSAFQNRLDLLDERSRLRYLSLSVFPAAFTAEMAHRVCRTPAFALNILADKNLLERDHDGKAFSFLEPIKACALRRVPAPSLHKLQERLYGICREHVIAIVMGDDVKIGRFISTGGARQYLSWALDWVMAGKVCLTALNYIDCLRCCIRGEIASRAIPWIALNLGSGSLSLEERLWATYCLGKLFTDCLRFREAIPCYLHALDIEGSDGRNVFAAGLHEMLAVAYHHAEIPDSALKHNGIAREFYTTEKDVVALAGCLRFRGEILTALGDTDGVLNSLTEACAIYRDLAELPLGLAECLYWMAEAYNRLERRDEALEALEESLSLRLDAGETTGAGHCLAKIGAIRSVQGRTAEGRAHIHHAILLHEQQGDMASRAAAVGCLGDALLREGKVELANKSYADGLAYWQVQNHARWCEIFNRRLSNCL